MAGVNVEQSLALYATANPFDSANALKWSNYSAVIGEKLVRLLDWRKPTPSARLADRAMRTFLLSDGFPCVAGKASVLTAGYRFGYYPGGKAGIVEGLARDLSAFVAERAAIPARYATFVAVFDESIAGERDFESWLWRILVRLHALDAPHHAWDPTVSKDPAAGNFAFSFGGNAFFVVGMHPHSSRLSRRFFLPTLVFNLHSQFNEARQSGAFLRIRSAVRARETALQGSLNPELSEFGETSEARQYAGRKVEEHWKCPFTTAT